MNWTDLIPVAAGLYLLFRIWRFFRPPLDPAAAAADVKAGRAVLVDVREPSEWAGGVITPAALLPLSDLYGDRGAWGPFLKQNRDRRLMLYCLSGSRSGVAAAKLRHEGFQAVNAGTFHGWRRAGWKVIPPPPS
jgi:rhodanese-related sulfurtransferase